LEKEHGMNAEFVVRLAEAISSSLPMQFGYTLLYLDNDRIVFFNISTTITHDAPASLEHRFVSTK